MCELDHSEFLARAYKSGEIEFVRLLREYEVRTYIYGEPKMWVLMCSPLREQEKIEKITFEENAPWIEIDCDPWGYPHFVLATRRNPDEPRFFRSLEAAILVLEKIQTKLKLPASERYLLVLPVDRKMHDRPDPYKNPSSAKTEIFEP